MIVTLYVLLCGNIAHPNGWLEILLDATETWPNSGKNCHPSFGSNPSIFWILSTLSDVDVLQKQFWHVTLCGVLPTLWTMTFVNVPSWINRWTKSMLSLSASSNICSAATNWNDVTVVLVETMWRLPIPSTSHEWFPVLMVLTLLNQLHDLVLACCVLLLDCRKYSRCSVIHCVVADFPGTFRIARWFPKWSCFIDLMDHVPNSISTRLVSLSDTIALFRWNSSWVFMHTTSMQTTDNIENNVASVSRLWKCCPLVRQTSHPCQNITTNFWSSGISSNFRPCCCTRLLHCYAFNRIICNWKIGKKCIFSKWSKDAKFPRTPRTSGTSLHKPGNKSPCRESIRCFHLYRSSV